jgi:hypothetical protein
MILPTYFLINLNAPSEYRETFDLLPVMGLIEAIHTSTSENYCLVRLNNYHFDWARLGHSQAEVLRGVDLTNASIEYVGVEERKYA